MNELVSHCEPIKTELKEADAQYCNRYLQGFIDGTVVTNLSAMINIEPKHYRKEGYSERATRTKAPNKAGKLKAVVDQTLVKLDIRSTANSPIGEAVYKPLHEQYFCGDE